MFSKYCNAALLVYLLLMRKQKNFKIMTEMSRSYKPSYSYVHAKIEMVLMKFKKLPRDEDMDRIQIKLI